VEVAKLEVASVIFSTPNKHTACQGTYLEANLVLTLFSLSAPALYVTI